jgi:biotin carboxyl carrier protein
LEKYRYRVTVDGRIFDVTVEELAAFPSMQEKGIACHQEELPSSQLPPDLLSIGAWVDVEAPMPGSIVELAVKKGDVVKAGDVLLILEAMKMENEITAPQGGRVQEILVQAGDTVAAGDILLRLVS